MIKSHYPAPQNEKNRNSISMFKIAATYIGTVVGAGFATGQEVLQFFTSFGVKGIWGIVLTTILFIIFGFVIIELGHVLNAKSHLDVLTYSSGKIFGSIMDVIITFFLFGSLTAMIAGTGALFTQFGYRGISGNLIMAVIAAITVFTGINGVINSISAVVPFLLVSVISICLMSIAKTPPQIHAGMMIAKSELIHSWALSSILYTSYNIVGSISVLGALGAHAADKKAIRNGGILGGLGLGICSIMIYLAISGHITEVKNLEVPMAFIAGNISYIIQMIFSLILVAEVYTTAISSLYGFVSRLTDVEGSPRKWKTVTISTTAGAFIASLFGFSNLVKYLYPLVGYGGILLLINLLYCKIKSPRKLS